MSGLQVPHDWIVNHMRVASMLAMTIEAYARQYKHEVFELLDHCGDAEWKRFARLSCCSDDSEYVPSGETRVIVRELIRDDQRVLCVQCGLTQACRKDRVEAIEGDEICLRCWRSTYVLEEERPPLPENVTPLKRVQRVGKLGPWRARQPPSTPSKE